MADTQVCPYNPKSNFFNCSAAASFVIGRYLPSRTAASCPSRLKIKRRNSFTLGSIGIPGRRSITAGVIFFCGGREGGGGGGRGDVGGGGGIIKKKKKKLIDTHISNKP